MFRNASASARISGDDSQLTQHYAAACFHAQQATEKALKAVLFSQGSRVVWGHSVRELARQCEAHAPAFAGMAGETALLDQFYIPISQYPNALP